MLSEILIEVVTYGGSVSFLPPMAPNQVPRCPSVSDP
jgi:hypothetical protein